MDPSQLLPAREQMAFTLGFHIVLVPFGVAFTFLMLVANYRGLRRGDDTALLLARRWSQVAAVLFAVGAVSGTVLSFELGLLWPRLMGTFGAAYGIPTVALRLFNVYGPGQALSNPYTGVAAIFASRLLNGRAPVIFEDGRQSRDFIHVSDIVHGIVLALESEDAVGSAINLGTGRVTTVDVGRLAAQAEEALERLRATREPARVLVDQLAPVVGQVCRALAP